MRPSRKVYFTIALLCGFLGIIIFVLQRSPVHDEARPDQLNFGTVSKGARIEASVWVLVSPSQSVMERAIESGVSPNRWRWIALLDKFNPKRLRSPPTSRSLSRLHPEIHVPPFVHLTRITPRQNPRWFQGTPFFELDLLVDTSTAGLSRGKITAQLGRREVSLPIEISVREPESKTRLLVVSPFYGNAARAGTNLNPAVELLSSLPCRVDYLRILPASFQDYKVVFLSEGPVANLSGRQVDDLKSVIEKGGRVVLACNHFFPETVEGANRLATNYGLRVMTNWIMAAMSTNIGRDFLTTNVHVVRSNFSPIETVGPNVKPLIFSNDGSNSVAAVARLPTGGELVVLTTAVWWNSLKQLPTNNDDRILLRNILTPSIEYRK
jgi:hypothetical protein